MDVPGYPVVTISQVEGRAVQGWESGSKYTKEMP